VKLLFSITLLVFAAMTVCAQDDSRLEVKLSLGEGKTSYRAGEPITLVLTFRSYTPGYFLSAGHEVIDTVQDEVLVTPTNGVFEWKKQYMRGAKYTSDAISLLDLSESPGRVEVPLNHFVRFEAPGRYTVRVKTKRIWLGRSAATEALTTNDVSFDVTMMSESEEAAEVARLSAAIDKASGWEERTRLMSQLSYLTGKAAIPEKIKRFLAPDDSGNYHQAARYGLYMSKDRPTIIKMLEDVFRDVNRPINFSLLSVLSTLKRLQDVPPPSKPLALTPFHYEEDQDERKIRDAYLRDIVDSLPRRKGQSLREAAYLILQNLPRKDPPAEILRTVRGILIKHFDELTFSGKEMLLSTYWETIRDPKLIPSLERMLKIASYPDYARGIMRGYALRRLSELDPERARPFVISEIRDADSMFSDEVVESLEDGRLSEVDDALVQQIRRFGSAERVNADSSRLRLRCIFAARFATKTTFPELLTLYKTDADKWQYDSRAFLLSYFSRFDPQQTLELLEAEISKTDKQMVGSFLYNMTRFHYAQELTPLLEKRLVSEDYAVASSGAYILSKHGPASSRAKIEARLERWLTRWRNREFELEGVQMKPEDQGQAMLQVELILALRDAKNWKLTETELSKLISECRTELCGQHFRLLTDLPTQ
jgi:hypothetical protein